MSNKEEIRAEDLLDGDAGGLPRLDQTRVSNRSAPSSAVAPRADGAFRITACPDAKHIGRSFPLHGEDPIRVGRNEGNDIVLNDPTVSGQHALLVPAPGKGHVVHDLTSANGTWVNGQRVTAQQLLVHGDVVLLGATTLAYERRRATDR
jgi:hypothetical protein